MATNWFHIKRALKTIIHQLLTCEQTTKKILPFEAHFGRKLYTSRLMKKYFRLLHRWKHSYAWGQSCQQQKWGQLPEWHRSWKREWHGPLNILMTARERALMESPVPSLNTMPTKFTVRWCGENQIDPQSGWQTPIKGTLRTSMVSWHPGPTSSKSIQPTPRSRQRERQSSLFAIVKLPSLVTCRTSKHP